MGCCQDHVAHELPSILFLGAEPCRAEEMVREEGICVGPVSKNGSTQVLFDGRVETTKKVDAMIEFPFLHAVILKMSDFTLY